MIWLSRYRWMWPVVGVMWVVVAGTILASWRPSRTWTTDPWTTSPLVGDRMVSLAGLLGRAVGVVLPAEAVPPEQPANTSATATSSAGRMVRCLLTFRSFPLTCR